MEWISALTAVLALLISITGYFIKKHIETVEQDIKRINTNIGITKQDIIALTNQISNLKQYQIETRQGQKELSSKLEARIDEVIDVSFDLKSKIKDHERHLENYGNVIRKYLLKR